MTGKGTQNQDQTHVDFFSYVSLFLRIMKLDCKEEQKIQITQLHQVLELLALTTECYHVAIERYFEWKTSADKPSCPKHCSKCRGEIADATGRIKKVCWQSVLTEAINGASGGVSVGGFLKTLKKARKNLFHKDDVPKGSSMSQMHAVCLQIVARGIISTNVTDHTKVGTEKLPGRISQ